MDFSRAHFENPLCLWLAALAVAGLAGLIAFAAAARRRQLASFVDAAIIEQIVEKLGSAVDAALAAKV